MSATNESAAPKGPSEQQRQMDEKLREAARKQNEREAQLSSLLGQGDARGLKLVGGSVSESTFIDAVKENMEVFEVSKAQAVKDVVQEFRLMGLDVSELAERYLNDSQQE